MAASITARIIEDVKRAKVLVAAGQDGPAFVTLQVVITPSAIAPGGPPDGIAGLDGTAFHKVQLGY